MLVNDLFTRQFLLFLLICGSAASLNFGLRIILGQFMSYPVSIAIAYMVGIVIAYTLCRWLVFKPKRNTTIKQISYFCLVNLFAIFLAVSVSVVFADYILLFIKQPFIRAELAHFIGICSPAITSYLGHKYLSFK